jgi:N-acetylated-alpha-linked acidic dipeptidase
MTYGVALAQTTGRLVLRMANADVIPQDFIAPAARIEQEVGELHELVRAMRARTNALNALVDSRARRTAPDVAAQWLPLEKEAPIPSVDFGPLDRAVGRLKLSADKYETALADIPRLDRDRRRNLNRILLSIEQSLTDARGLPGRPWYRHLLYAPGMLTGYAAKIAPGVREAIEDRNWIQVGFYMDRTARAIDAYRQAIDRAAALLKPKPGARAP